MHVLQSARVAKCTFYKVHGKGAQRCKGAKVQRNKGAKGKSEKLTVKKIRGQASKQNTQASKQISGVTSSLLYLLIAAKNFASRNLLDQNTFAAKKIGSTNFGSKKM